MSLSDPIVVAISSIVMLGLQTCTLCMAVIYYCHSIIVAAYIIQCVVSPCSRGEYITTIRNGSCFT